MFRRMLYCGKVLIGVGIGITLTLKLVRSLTARYTAKNNQNLSTVCMKVRKEDIGNIIGRRGSVINNIRKKTDTKITVSVSGDEGCVTIVGHWSDVESAVSHLHEVISNPSDLYVRDLTIPAKAFDSNRIRHIASFSEATIAVDWSPIKSDTHNVVIKGTREQVHVAVQMIDEMFAAEEVHYQQTIGVAGSVLPGINALSISKPQCDVSNEIFPSDVFVPVFVSAVVSPSLFWVQLVGAKSVDLDKLLDEMTEFYSEQRNQNEFQITEPYESQLVAAFLSDDDKWYRARISHVETNNNVTNETELTVFFVDFGDDTNVRLSDICKLKPEYLILPLQAIKCCLGDIVPKNGEWNEDAISLFEKLCYFSQWKTIIAEPILNKNEQSVNDPVLVKLYDTTTKEDIIISKQLVEAGYAEWK